MKFLGQKVAARTSCQRACGCGSIVQCSFLAGVPPIRTAYGLGLASSSSKRARFSPSAETFCSLPEQSLEHGSTIAEEPPLEIKSSTIDASHNLLYHRAANISRIAYSISRPARTARSTNGFLLNTPTLMMVALTAASAGVAALWQRINTVRSCTACRGYGIQRCKLCQGKGAIQWQGKKVNQDSCPMCLGRRYNTCSCCGGVFGSPILVHRVFRHRAGRSQDAKQNKTDEVAFKKEKKRLLSRSKVVFGDEDDDRALTARAASE
jgi:hypothetical protein